jgi:hypothetical protein
VRESAVPGLVGGAISIAAGVVLAGVVLISFPDDSGG